MNDLKGLFLESYDNLEQSWITFKLLEPSHTLAKRAARSAASVVKMDIVRIWQYCELVPICSKVFKIEFKMTGGL